MTEESRYAISSQLAGDMAEDYLASEIADMMRANSREKARAVRELSEANTDQLHPAVQNYRNIQRIMCSAVWDMLGGKNGWLLVKQGENNEHLANP